MGEQDGETGEPRSLWDHRLRGHVVQPEPPMFRNVSNRDLVTLADVLCRSLEFHSMLVALKVMSEVGTRELWPAVIDRRAHMISLSVPDPVEADGHRIATLQIQRFRDEHFPVEPERFGDDPTNAASLWNGYIAF